MAFLLSSVLLFLPHPLVETMTVEEKVGQTMMCSFTGDTCTEKPSSLICDLHIGGVIYYTWANGLTSPKHVQKLSNELQIKAKNCRTKIPLLIAVDQEGGLIERLVHGFTSFPGNRSLGFIDDLELTENIAEAQARELASVGIHLNFAPSVDVATHPYSYIDIRSFGANPQKVSKHAKAVLRGFQKGGVLGCLKHYPGHGDVISDTHENVGVVVKSKEELESTELLPFFENLDAPFIMTAHIKAKALDEHTLSTLSSTVLSLLRNTKGYNGVIISDSLVMKGVIEEGGSIEECAVKAFQAGTDMLLFGGRKLFDKSKDEELTFEEMKKIHGFVVQQVKEGHISEERLNESVSRILYAKEKVHLFQSAIKKESDLKEVFETKKFQTLQQEACRRSLEMCSEKTVTMWKEKRLKNKHKKLLVIAPQHVIKTLSTIENIYPLPIEQLQLKQAQLNETSIENESINVSKLLLDHQDVVFITYNAFKDNTQETALKSMVSEVKNPLIITIRNSFDRELFKDSHVPVINTHSPTKASIQEAFKYLENY